MRIKLLHCLQIVAIAMMTIAIVGCQKESNEGTGGGENNSDKYPSSTAFTIVNTSTEHTSLKVDIIPEDKESEYIVFISEVMHFQANRIDTAEELFEDDYVYFREFASEYNMSVHTFLERAGWLAKGDKRGYSAINLYPDTDYIVYCYGVTFEGEDNYTPSTDVAYKVIRTTTPQMLDITFDINCDVNGNNVTIDIAPNNYDGLYYHYIVDEADPLYLYEGATPTEEYITICRNQTLEEFNERINDEGYAPESFCHSGNVTLTERLLPNTNYMVISFAVSDERMPLLCSTPTVAHFSTGESQLSDTTFNIEVSNITPYYAYLDITPATDDEYACLFLAADQLPNTDDEFTDMELIIEYYQPAILKGKHSEKLFPLMPSKEYVVVAFGIKDDMPTSHMTKYSFFSEEAVPGTVSITDIELVKLYDAKEILAIDSSYSKFIGEAECLGIVEAKTSTPTTALYFWWFEEWQKVEYTDEAFLEDLLLYDPVSSNPTVMQMYYSIDEQDKFLFAGIAEDEDGNLSEIYYGDAFILTEDMTSPAEEFFAWMESNK